VSDPEPLVLNFPSAACELPRIREELRSWTDQCGWTVAQIDEIVLAVDEAVSNVICHGYANDPNNQVELSMRCVQDAKEGAGLEIRIRDYGKQIDPAEIRGRALDDVRPGGLGVHIMRSLMNSVEYTRAEGGGMLLTMRKFRSHSAARDCNLD